MTKKVRTLLFSTLYPSSARPRHGIFVENRLLELLKSDQVETKVVAPVPWFYSTNERHGDYARMAATPRRELHNGIDVSHPRYFMPPKIGMNVAPFLLALGAIGTIRDLQREGFDFDLIDAHYYYPDGVAAALLAKYFDKPFVITARGTDINLLPDYPIPRRLIRYAANTAFASISVSRALSDKIANLCSSHAKLVVLRNGVDLVRFHPIPRPEARAMLRWPDVTTLLSVGNLVELKGHHLIIEALAKLPECNLAIVGDGPERSALQSLAIALGVSDRVIFVGSVAQEELFKYYSAADVLVLASSREGWANVLLESMACGTPVVATNISGNSEVVTAPAAGQLSLERSAESLAEATGLLFARMPTREAVREYAEQFTWENTTAGQLDLFREAIMATYSSVA